MKLYELFDINEKRLKKRVARDYITLDGEYMMMVLLFIQNNEGKILLLKSGAFNKWIVPGDYVTQGKPLNNIRSIITKYLGIDIIDDLKNIDTIITYSYIYKIYYLTKDINLGDININKDEVLKVNYFTLREIDKMIDDELIKSNNVIFLDCLKRYLH